MSTKPFIPEGSVHIEGRSEAKARELLKLAEDAGMVGTVYTTSFGYIVPKAILKVAAEAGEENTETAEESAKAAEENTPEEFNPSDATVEEVQDYLNGADDTERERVLAAEAAGKKRKSLLSATTEGEK